MRVAADGKSEATASSRRGFASVAAKVLALGLASSNLCVAMELQSWDNKIERPHERFRVLREFNDQAVLDRETQLVWMRDAGAIGLTQWKSWPFGDGGWYAGALEICAKFALGNRGGWRLPSLHELSSLATNESQSDNALPAGHPFQNVVGPYWTATTYSGDELKAWAVAFRASFGADETPKNATRFVWCVRGGNPGPDRY